MLTPEAETICLTTQSKVYRENTLLGLRKTTRHVDILVSIVDYLRDHSS